MDINIGYYEEDEREAFLRAQRRKARVSELRARKMRQRKVRWVLTKILPFCLASIGLIVGLVFGIRGIVRAIAGSASTDTISWETIIEETTSPILLGEEVMESNQDELTQDGMKLSLEAVVTPVESHPTYYAEKTEHTGGFGSNIYSTGGILINSNQHTILASVGGEDRIVPASMTKVLTLLVAVEHIDNLDDTFAIPEEATAYSYNHDCSAVGFANNEVVTVRDLLYGTVLPSGGDAAYSLALYVAGSHDAFVQMMNDKLDELGIENTHMTNCIGLFDENHYSTCYDIAMIMAAAMDNEICKEILSEHKYTTSSTPAHPQGIEISNWFLRRVEDKEGGEYVIGAKTGYVVESGNCAVSFAGNEDGDTLICVTLNAGSNWRCIYDHAAIYKEYLSVAG